MLVLPEKKIQTWMDGIEGNMLLLKMILIRLMKRCGRRKCETPDG